MLAVCPPKFIPLQMYLDLRSAPRSMEDKNVFIFDFLILSFCALNRNGEENIKRKRIFLTDNFRIFVFIESIFF